MTGQQLHTANAQQSYIPARPTGGLASRTSQRTDQSLPKSMPAPTQEKIQNIFSCLFKKIKTPVTQADNKKTVKLNNDNGLQGRTTEHQLPTFIRVDETPKLKSPKVHLNTWGSLYRSESSRGFCLLGIKFMPLRQLRYDYPLKAKLVFKGKVFIKPGASHFVCCPFTTL